MIVAGDMNDYDGLVLDSFRFEVCSLWIVFVVWGLWRGVYGLDVSSSQ